MQMPDGMSVHTPEKSVRSSHSVGKELSAFDSSKWKKIIIGNVEMVQKKVD